MTPSTNRQGNPATPKPRRRRKALPLVLADFGVRFGHCENDQFLKAVVELLLEQTESSDAGINLFDISGRLIAATDFPVTPEKEDWFARYGHILSLLLAENFMMDYVWDMGPNVAFAFPDAVFQTSALYKFVYSRIRADYMSLIYFSPKPDGTMLAMVLSRTDRAYNRRELRAFQVIAMAFRDRITNIATAQPLRLEHFVRETIIMELDATFHGLDLTIQAESIIALYFGFCERLPDGRSRLPAVFERRLRDFWSYALTQFPPGAMGIDYSFCHTCRGRRLCIMFSGSSDGRIRVCLTEDIGRLREIANIRQLCGRMTRDRYSTFAVCMSLLDGISETKALMKHSGIAALKLSSAHKLISKAKSIIDQVSDSAD